MPTPFPVLTDDGLTEVDHYSLAEVARMLHMGYSTAQRDVHRQKWPHVKVAHRFWFSEADIAQILRILRPYDGPEERTEPAPLGLVVPPEGDDGPPVIR